MKKFLQCAFLGILFFFFSSPTSAVTTGSERVTNFKSEIIINQDTSIDIVESIDYFSPVQKHGIYRYIPEKYREDGAVKRYEVSMIQVSDGTEVEVPFETYRENDNVVIKIGDPNETFSGLRKYQISYSVKNAIKRQNSYDELYWDITGEGWLFPLQATSAKVISDHAKITETKCFTGTVGSTESNCVTESDGRIAKALTEKAINYGDNLTVAVKLDPNNGLLFPSSTEILMEKIKNNWPLFLLPLPALVMFLYWYKKGRDYRFDSANAFNLDPLQPQKQRPLFERVNIPMSYEPLKELTPGESGIMMDEKADNQDVVAEIIELARKKYLKIERVENKGFLKFGHDYVFTKLKTVSTKLPTQQEYLMQNIFETKEEIKLSELKGTFYTHMAKVKEMMNSEMKKRKLFTTNPDTARALGVALAVFLNGAVVVNAMGTLAFLSTGWPVLLIFASVVVSLIFAWNMPQKTALGTNLALQAKGLRETIQKGKWREEIKEKHLFIEEVLPFAIALGVIGKLTKDMASLNIVPPKYISGGFGTNTLAWSGFVNDFSTSASSGLSYNPSSSSSGGSGFSGGSSGGGGGGGGGGSW